MSDVAVSVQGLGKRYRIVHQQARYGRLTESVAGLIRTPFDRLRGHPREDTEWFWALQDVSFEVKAGEVMGIIGRNGAGKSTLLKILSRVTEPTSGRAELRGRVASLLEVGTGFHPELSGRENIYLSGSILGMTKQEMDKRFDEIVDFAEVESFLDTPVKRYSSGMSVRLGFAVAAHLEPDILIVDEVLAVGDASFQKKCLSKMGDVSGEGRTILFVSHNMPAVETLCTRAILLERGSVIADGTASEAVERYTDSASGLSGLPLKARTDRQGSGRLRFTAFEASIKTGTDSEIRLGYEADPGVANVDVSVPLFTMRGEGAANLWSAATGDTFASLPTVGTLVCRIPKAAVLPGIYRVNVFAVVNGEVADWVTDAATLEVASGDFFGTGRLPPPGYGSTLVAHSWGLEERGASG